MIVFYCTNQEYNRIFFFFWQLLLLNLCYGQAEQYHFFIKLYTFYTVSVPHLHLRWMRQLDRMLGYYPRSKWHHDKQFRV